MKSIIHSTEDPTFFSSIANLHMESKRWITELEFINREQLFYKELLVEHIIEKCETCNFKVLKLYLKAITHEFELSKRVLEKLKDHRINLSLLLENIYLKREDGFREDHKLLKIEMENYLENFNYIKEKIFAIVLDIMKKEKL